MKWKLFIVNGLIALIGALVLGFENAYFKFGDYGEFAVLTMLLLFIMLSMEDKKNDK